MASTTMCLISVAAEHEDRLNSPGTQPGGLSLPPTSGRRQMWFARLDGPGSSGGQRTFATACQAISKPASSRLVFAYWRLRPNRPTEILHSGVAITILGEFDTHKIHGTALASDVVRLII